MSIDFEQDQQKVIKKTDNIQSLADQVERLEDLQRDIELREENLKKLKKKQEHVSGEVIPTMMAEMGLSHLKLMDGSSVDVKPNYSANITVANKEKAFNWLRENGLGDIIKNEISVSFGRNEDTRAADYADLAKSHGFNLQLLCWLIPTLFCKSSIISCLVIFVATKRYGYLIFDYIS